MTSIADIFRIGIGTRVLDQVSDSIFVVDMDGSIIWANRELYRRLGKTEADLIGKTPDEWLASSQDNISASDAIQQCLRHGGYRFQPSFIGGDGAWRVADVSLRLVRNDQGEPQGIISISRDITELVRLQNDLLQAQKTMLVGELAGGVAHDINNTLAVILGNLELAQIGAQDPVVDDLLNTAAAAVHRGASVTHRLLAYARKQPLQPKVLNPSRVLSDVDALIAPLVGGLHLIKTKAADDLWDLNADEAQLQTVLMNLIINARDASPEGGKITIKAVNAAINDADRSGDSAVTAGEYVCFSVADTGTGIPAEHMDKIFDPYFTTKDVGKGSGLGLSMAYGFAKQSKGHIEIVSKEGDGTNVKLYMPRAKAVQRQADQGGRDKTHQPDSGATVFVLEDNQDLLSVTRAKLEQAGYTVLTASSYETAMERQAEFDGVDVFLVDVSLPGTQSGRDFSDAVAAQGHRTPMLFMTGHTDEVMLHHKVDDVPVRRLRKPFSFDQLLQELDAVRSPAER